MEQLALGLLDEEITDNSSKSAVYRENSDYLTKQIITYIGNKRALLPLIGYGVEKVKEGLNKNKLTTLDLFSGSGIVARFLKQHSDWLIANDLEAYSKLNNECYLTDRRTAERLGLKEFLPKLKQGVQDNWCTNGFISELYAPNDDKHIQAGERAFYTKRNAEYLDTARQEIAKLPEDIQKYFLAPLLSEASVHANTSGVFKGFYKDKNGIGCFGGSGKNALCRILGNIEVKVPVLSNFNCETSILQKDAYAAATSLPRVDLAYLDPPYNQHPYGSNYFMLNLLASYKRPTAISKVSGIPLEWNRSPYNKAKYAKEELFKVIDALNATYVLISYNSEGFVSYDQFVDFLSSLGDLQVLETKYNTFRGSRNLRDRDIHVKEYLFLLKKGN